MLLRLSLFAMGDFMDTNQQQHESLHVPLKERLKSIPEVFGIRLNEEPRYDVLKKDGNFEIRHYPKQLRAKVTLTELDFEKFREQAFEKLAAFIFGGNHSKTDISMTAPVLQEHAVQTGPHNGEPAQGWTMSFVMPSNYSFRSLPKPLDPAVKIEEAPGHDAAVVKYSGLNSLESIRENQEKLMAWLAQQPGMQKKRDMVTAQYDGPFVFPFMRRNEVQVEVQIAH